MKLYTIFCQTKGCDFQHDIIENMTPVTIACWEMQALSKAGCPHCESKKLFIKNKEQSNGANPSA